jgi:hypothetical protein
MGGGSGSSYITDSAGNVYPGASSAGSIDWSKLGGTVSKGFQQFGQQYGQSQQDSQNYMRGTPSLYQTPGDYQQAPVSFNMVPQSQGDLMAVLQRLLGGMG